MKTATSILRRLRAHVRPIHAFYPITLSVLLAMLRLPAAAPTIVAALGLLWLNVAVHEAGHIVLARAAGHRVVRVLILPGYGLTSVRSRGQRGRVTMMLAGPLSGALAAGGALLLLGVAAAAPLAPSAEALAWFGWAMLADNLMNLLPFGIMDGRRALMAHREHRVLARLTRAAALSAQATAASVARAAPEPDERETFAREARAELDELLAVASTRTPDAATARGIGAHEPAPACCEVTS